LFLASALAFAGDLVPEAPSAVLLDQATGRVLFQKNPDQPIPPASLTKLMTLHLVWKALAAGEVHAADLVPVTPATTGKSVPPGSSLMFLAPGQQVTVRELMLGLAVDSGNDAGMTLAQFLAGSQEAFVGRMNTEAQTLGLHGTVFFDSFGYDARNRTTADDFSRFSRYYIAAHPQALELLHSVKTMAYPLPENRVPGDAKPVRTIEQTNRNGLLGAYPGADGLKTGFIDESGYNMAATALRGNQRLVAVLLGVHGRDTAEGSRTRNAAAARLLDWGFANYPLRPLPVPKLKPVRAWYSEPGELSIAPSGPTVYPLADGELSGVEPRVEAPREIRGPVAAGTVVGRLVWLKNGEELYSVPLTNAEAARPAPWWVGAWDAVVLFFRGFTGTPAPVFPHT
jgi:D-alanyl-D-alanine carboxypeptidase (penicillin-binding protein 5/6)